MSVALRTPGGRPLVVLGAEHGLTIDRWNAVRDRMDADPRVVTCSFVPSEMHNGVWVRAQSPGGVVSVVATDVQDLVGEIPVDPEDLQAWRHWFAACSDRGFAHEWWLTDSSDLSSLVPWGEVNAQAVDMNESAAWSATSYSTGKNSVSVAVDATWLGPYETGAQVLTTHALAALAQRPEISRIDLVGVRELPEYASHLENIDAIRVVPGADEHDRADVVWYPNQIDARVDLSQARELGRRVVVTYLDLIAYDIPRYHGNPKLWQEYREQQRTVALRVDGVTTISRDVAKRLAAESPLLEGDRMRSIGLGVDHLLAREGGHSAPPTSISELAARLTERPFILVLGNDFLHKNRDFAIRTWQRLLEDGVSCDLVLAGLHVRGSSSKDAEAGAVAGHVNLRGDIHTLGHIDQETKLWLLENASVVHYPTSAEGFGFIPYEAAGLGTASSFTAFGPLAEFIDDPSLPANWTLDEHVRDITGLVTDEDARRHRLDRINAARRRLTWAAFAEELADFFLQTSNRPPVAASVIPTGAEALGDSGVGTRLRARSRAAAKRILGRGP